MPILLNKSVYICIVIYYHEVFFYDCNYLCIKLYFTVFCELCHKMLLMY